MKVFFATHAATIDGFPFDGIGNTLSTSLNNSDIDFIHLSHSIDGKLKSRIVSKQNLKFKKFLIPKHPQVMRWISEVIVTAFQLWKYKPELFIGVDPLNAFAGVLIKPILRNSQFVFLVSDYSPERFSNKIINKIFYLTENFCLSKVDEIWVVSERIENVMVTKYGINPEKIRLLPNTPSSTFEKLQLLPQKNKYRLVTTGLLEHQLEFKELFIALLYLSKVQPLVSLVIVGDGSELVELKKIVSLLGIEKIVDFQGRRSIEETMNLISLSGVGLALYNGKWNFNYFGDSTKCREYMFLGLPVITTDSHSTVTEIVRSGAGIVVTQNSSAYVDALFEIWNNYETYANSSFEAGALYKDIHLSAINELLNKRVSKKS